MANQTIYLVIRTFFNNSSEVERVFSSKDKAMSFLHKLLEYCPEYLNPKLQGECLILSNGSQIHIEEHSVIGD